ncbi:MAG: hypothetical protein V7K88_10290 [Nostoc sp.]|uniref:hypothetical protein n=1 Tax=Nostoc sp. TaxID=1180 RepID=UPI002FF85591
MIKTLNPNLLNQLTDQDRDRLNQAIFHAMELQPDNRPETVEHWLKESYQVNLTSQ